MNDSPGTDEPATPDETDAEPVVDEIDGGPVGADAGGDGASVKQPGDANVGDADPSVAEPAPAVARRPRHSPGGWQDIEDGIGAMFEALERGVLNIADEQGRKRKEREAIESRESGAPVPDEARQSADAGDTAVVVAAASAELRADDETLDPSAQALATTSDEPPEVTAEVRAPRPGMTYDEVLTPVRWRNLIFGVVAAVVLAVLYWGVSLAQVVTTADDDDRRPADAIIVLGAAQFDGTPSPVLATRLDHALELWQAGLADLIVTTGSNREGDRFTEGFSGFVYLRDAGVPESAIVNIVDGADTYQQLTAALAQLADRELATALLVSDGYHSFRLQSIADEIGLEAWVSPTGIESTTDDYLRESAAVSFGRLFSYRRLSAWNNPVDEPGSSDRNELEQPDEPQPGDEPVDGGD